MTDKLKELLEALKATLQWIDDNCETTGFETVEAQADAAIAKAVYTTPFAAAVSEAERVERDKELLGVDLTEFSHPDLVGGWKWQTIELDQIKKWVAAARLQGAEEERKRQADHIEGMKDKSHNHLFRSALSIAAADVRENEAGKTEQASAVNQGLLSVLSDIAHGLEGARIWGGMDWTYNPLHPFKYLPLREKARAAIAAAETANAPGAK